MEIRRLLWGDAASAAVSARPAQRAEGETAESVKEPGDRLELTRQWTEQMKEQMEEQNARLRALLSQPAGEESDEDSGGLLGYMETEEDKLDAMSDALDIQMKCLKIAMNIMKGKKVPPEDERYLMEHDPNGYKLAMAMKSMVKEDKKECKSVLDDEDKNGGENSDSGEAESPSGGEAAVSSGGGEAVE